jgi:hypothetical protein
MMKSLTYWLAVFFRLLLFDLCTHPVPTVCPNCISSEFPNSISRPSGSGIRVRQKMAASGAKLLELRRTIEFSVDDLVCL